MHVHFAHTIDDQSPSFTRQNSNNCYDVLTRCSSYPGSLLTSATNGIQQYGMQPSSAITAVSTASPSQQPTHSAASTPGAHATNSVIAAGNGSGSNSITNDDYGSPKSNTSSNGAGGAGSGATNNQTIAGSGGRLPAFQRISSYVGGAGGAAGVGGVANVSVGGGGADRYTSLTNYRTVSITYIHTKLYWSEFTT